MSKEKHLCALSNPVTHNTLLVVAMQEGNENDSREKIHTMNPGRCINMLSETASLEHSVGEGSGKHLLIVH